MCKASPANGPGGSEQESSRSSFPAGSGTTRTQPAAWGWVLSCSMDAALCLCMGRTTFWSGEEAVLALVSCPHTPLHTPRPDYIHSIYTHTRPRGQRACHCSASNRKAVSLETKKKIPKPQPLQELTHVSLAGFCCQFVSQKLSLVTGLSRPLSASWLVMRLRLRFSLVRSLSKTSPERRADTRSSNSPLSSPVSFAFLALRSRSRCSFSCRSGGQRRSQSHTGGCGGAQYVHGDPQSHGTRVVSHPSA